MAIQLLALQGKEQTALDDFSGVHVSVGYRLIHRRWSPACQALDDIGQGEFQHASSFILYPVECP